MNEPLKLLETILYIPNQGKNDQQVTCMVLYWYFEFFFIGFYLLDSHLARLERSANDLNYPQPNKTSIKDQLVAQVPSNEPQRVSVNLQ
jgi:hypothetical protein